MDWRERLNQNTNQILTICGLDSETGFEEEKKQVKQIFNQLLDQRDKEIIGKMETISFIVEEYSLNTELIELDQATSTIKESK